VRQLEVQALDEVVLTGALRIGGLRAGWASATSQAVTLHGYSYVPGVSVSGRILGGETVLRVSGGAAARGMLRVGAHESLAGTLGGGGASPGASLDRTAVGAAIVRADAQAGHLTAHGGPAGRAVARILARLLARRS